MSKRNRAEIRIRTSRQSNDKSQLGIANGRTPYCDLFSMTNFTRSALIRFCDTGKSVNQRCVAQDINRSRNALTRLRDNLAGFIGKQLRLRPNSVKAMIDVVADFVYI